MKLELYSVYDKVSDTFENVFAFKSKADAIRQFSLTVNSKGNMLFEYPNDYEVVHIADFNTENGTIGIVTDDRFSLSSLKKENSDPATDAFEAAAVSYLKKKGVPEFEVQDAIR